jgi:hypothetical protein
VKRKYSHFITPQIAQSLFVNGHCDHVTAWIAASVYIGTGIKTGVPEFLQKMGRQKRKSLPVISKEDVEKFLALYALANKKGSLAARGWFIKDQKNWF